MTVLDLFAGAGGFSLGAHAITDDVIGVELDTDAAATQGAAGMRCVQADITTVRNLFTGFGSFASHPQRFNLSRPLHVHASPPCQTFSVAGKGDGRRHLEALGRAAYYIIIMGEHFEDLSEVPEGSLLVLEPAGWIHALRPDSISMEQVRSVLPIWESYAAGLKVLGYQTWTALLHSEQYGVPQTRTRAWLGASLHREVEAPAPTHSRYHVRNPAKLDEGLLPWVSMAEALGWEGDDLAGFPRRADRGAVTTIGGVDYRARDLRQGDQPAFGVTEKARSWTHMMRDPGTAARRVTVEEAGILQGFPADFPWQGSKTSQFRQVGNAVNPAVAEAVLRSVL